MSELKLTDAESIEVIEFYDGSSKQVREGKLDVDRWSKYGNDRLYVNAGISKCDKYSLYVDLETHEIVSDNDGKHKGGSVEINGDEAVITIIESGISDKEHKITVALDGEGFEAADEEDEDDEDDEPEIACDGGEDVTAHVDDSAIEDAIESNDDPDHPDALTVEEVRDLLACIQRGAEVGWDTYMDHVEDGDAEVVADDGDYIVLSTGEHNSVAEELDLAYEGDVEVDSIAKSVVTQIHHELARERCDYDWSVTYPYVIRKPEGTRDGQRYVEAVINGLMGEGLSPGQAWAVYGVHVLGHSRNKWASMCGYSDHSAISEPLRKAEEKAGYLGLLK